MFKVKGLQLRDCLGLDAVDRLYYVSGQDINPSTGKAYAINPSSGVWDDNYFASNFGGGSSGGGGGTPRLDFAKGLTDQYKTQDAGLAATQKGAQQNLVNYYSGLQDPISRFNTFNDQNGVSEQQKLVDSLTHSVLNTTQQLNAIPDSVKQRSGDFMINDADKTAIINHEAAPVQKALASLISGKQDAEVGLQAKQALVQNLLQLSFKGDEMGAKPLQLGVDYSTADRDAARQLFMDVMGVQTTAFNGDQDSNDANKRAADDRAFQQAMQQATFGQQTNMENLSSKNQLSNSLAMANFDVAHRVGSGGAAAPNDNPIYAGKSTAQIKQIQQNTTDAWNKVVGGAKTEYDVWKAINSNQNTFAKQGVDVQQLWSQHAALAANVGQGGSIRKTDGKTYTIDGKTYTIPN